MTTFQAKGRNFLSHYGRKGMKWGVRRSDAQLARESGKGQNDDNPSKAKPAADKTTSTKGLSKKTDTSKLSDAQLKAAVNRLNMEQQYAKLTERKSIAEKGAEFLTGVAVNVVRQQLTAVVNDRASQVIGAQLKKKGPDPFKSGPYIPPANIPKPPKRNG